MATRAPALMSIQPRLPIEVLEAVIDEASDNPRTLRNLSLTCITLLPWSRIRLFSGLVIRTVQQLEESRNFLDLCPWLPPLVRKVTLSVTIPKENDKPNIRLLDVVPVHLFTRLPNLCAWTMKAEDSSFPIVIASLALHHSSLQCYHIYGGHIRSLELSRIRFHSKSHFKGLVSAFTSLDSLTCYGIQFHSSKQQPVIAATVTTNIRQLPISTLNISTSMDRWALEYLLACSALKPEHLTIQLRVIDLSSHYLEQLKQLLMQLLSLSSLVLVISLIGILPIVNDDQLSTTIHFAMMILKHVNRDYPTDVHVEFKADPLAKLGAPIFKASASLDACKQLETALLTLPKAPVLVHDPVYNWRAGRANFWSPTIRRAFPRLNDLGLLTLKFLPSKEDAPDPVGHEYRVTCVVVSHDSAWTVTSSSDGTIIVWDTVGGAVLHEWLAHRGSPINYLALAPDSRRLVSAGGHTLMVWDINSGPILEATLEGHTNIVRTCTWSPDGVLIASTSWDRTVRIWDGYTYEQCGLVQVGDDIQNGQVQDPLQFSPDSCHIAWISVGDGAECWVWQPFTGYRPEMLGSPQPYGGLQTMAFSFSPERHRITTAHGSHGLLFCDPGMCIVKIWDLATGAMVAVLTGHSKPVRSVSFSSDGRSLLSVDKDMSMWVWDCGTWSGKQTGVSRDSEPRVWHEQLCVRRDGKYVATRPHRGSVRLWRTSDGECVATFDDHNTFVYCIEFSPNGQFLVTGDQDGIVHVHCLSRFITE